MGNPVYQFENPNNWNDVYFQTINAYQINSTRYAPIPRITVPVQLNSPVLAVYITCTPNNPNWYFAGFLGQKIFTGLTVGGSPDAENVQRRKLWLNKLTIIRLEKLTDAYSISLDVPKWFQSISVNLWEYTGDINDSTELLIEELTADIARIEQKIDALN